MNYNFFMPVKLLTGEDCIDRGSGEMARLGKKCIIVTGKSSAVRSGALADVTAALAKEGITWTVFDEVEPNPLLDTCHRAGERAREFGAQFVIGIGGGSALDAAKAAAVFAAGAMEPVAVYDVNDQTAVLPIVAIGTTAGTGSEVSPFSVLTSPDGRKRSFSHAKTFPAISYGNPRYTYSLPITFTIGTALDALCHAVEGYFNVKALETSDIFAVEAVKMLLQALPQLEPVTDGKDVPHVLRGELYYASVLAGITLAQCGTCYCHRVGYFLTEDYDVPHGVACAAFLPGFLRRSARLMPQRTQAFLDGVGCTLEELCAMVEGLTEYDRPVLDDAELEEIARRGEGSGNYANTPPEGYGREEAYQLLKEMYGK